MWFKWMCCLGLFGIEAYSAKVVDLIRKIVNREMYSVTGEGGVSEQPNIAYFS